MEPHNVKKYVTSLKNEDALQLCWHTSPESIIGVIFYDIKSHRIYIENTKIGIGWTADIERSTEDKEKWLRLFKPVRGQVPKNVSVALEELQRLNRYREEAAIRMGEIQMGGDYEKIRQAAIVVNEKTKLFSESVKIFRQTHLKSPCNEIRILHDEECGCGM